MKNLIKFEFRKIWTKVTIVSVATLIIASTILNFISFFLGNTVITSEGKIVEGIKSFSELQNESKDIKGEMNQAYIDNLVKDYNSSIQKKEFRDKIGFDLTKYKYSNLIINFANYGKDTFSHMVDLDFDFLTSQKYFYDKYKKSMKETIRFNNQKNWFIYNEDQINKINEKVDNIKIPFKVDYYEGFEYFIWQYSEQYILVLIVIAFALSSLFSKDSNNGIDELTLSSKLGRKKNMNARIIGGNLFALIVYALFIGILLIQIGGVVSFKGWNQSIQNIWFTCLYNINIGTGILILILKGLVGVLICANLTMFASIRIKYSKLSTIFSLAFILIIEKLTYTENSLQLQLNPFYYVKSILSSEVYYFIGDKMIPYTIIFIFIALVYLIIIRGLTVMQYKKYKI